MQEFGFPPSYATIINRQGEYQIGNKIYWFHNKYKFEVNSEEELLKVKSNPDSYKNKTLTKSTIISEESILTGTSNRSWQNADQVYSTNVYTSIVTKEISPNFIINNQSGSVRRFTYGTRMYAEALGLSNGNQTYDTYMFIYVALEYYSFGRKRWYLEDEPFRLDYGFTVDANAYNALRGVSFGPNYLQPFMSGSQTSNIPNSNAYYSSIGVEFCHAYVEYPYHPDNRFTDLYWGFEIKGFVNTTHDWAPFNSYQLGVNDGTYQSVIW